MALFPVLSGGSSRKKIFFRNYFKFCKVWMLLLNYFTNIFHSPLPPSFVGMTKTVKEVYGQDQVVTTAFDSMQQGVSTTLSSNVTPKSHSLTCPCTALHSDHFFLCDLFVTFSLNAVEQMESVTGWGQPTAVSHLPVASRKSAKFPQSLQSFQRSLAKGMLLYTSG